MFSAEERKWHPIKVSWARAWHSLDKSFVSQVRKELLTDFFLFEDREVFGASLPSCPAPACYNGCPDWSSCTNLGLSKCKFLILKKMPSKPIDEAGAPNAALTYRESNPSQKQAQVKWLLSPSHCILVKVTYVFYPSKESSFYVSANFLACKFPKPETS